MKISKAEILGHLQKNEAAKVGEQSYKLAGDKVSINGAEAPLTIEQALVAIWKARKNLSFVV